MRTLAIDLGTRRIGLAISDAGGSWATPSDVLTVTDPVQAVAPILAVVKREDVRRLVVGLPLNMDGTAGPAARQAVQWATGVAASAATAPPTTPPPAASPDAGLVPIKSPMVGTFYAASSPDAKPFVTVGSTVDEETDVCVVEAMKVFNNIKAETRGTIAKVVVNNGQTVEFGQVLFLVKP